MLISDKSKKIIDSCRFCWMCRHICPIGNATGQERNNARARALSLSYVERGAAELADCMDNVYECALCGACTKECATGWDPVVFTKEVRREAALEGITPEYILKLVENYGETGNIYGKNDYCECIKNEIADLQKNSDTLLYIGADARYMAAPFAKNAVAALKKAGVNFTVLENEPESGFELDMLIGAAEETREAMQKCANVLNNYKNVIVLDPQDMKVFIREYKEWGINLTCNLTTYTSKLAELASESKISVAKLPGKITYQDNPFLVREVGETEEGRKFVSAAGEYVEMILSGKDTMFAGSFIMSMWMNDVMKLVAKERMNNIVQSGANTVVCASPAEYSFLREAAPDGISVKEISELVL